MAELQVTVIGDSTAGGEKQKFCVQLGAMLAELGCILITGGRGGVMEAVSEGCSDAGGITVGILPSADKRDANPYCRIVIPTGLAHSRNSLTVLAADVVIVIGGQAGTLTEMGFAWIYHKPVIAVTTFGGFAAQYAGKKLDSRREDTIRGVSSLKELRDLLVQKMERAI